MLRSGVGIAHRLLSEIGVQAFAARVARELHATGVPPRKRTVEPIDQLAAGLTAHGVHIARLVASGATNREVGA